MCWSVWLQPRSGMLVNVTVASCSWCVCCCQGRPYHSLPAAYLPTCLPACLTGLDAHLCVCACVSVAAPAVEAEAKMLKGMRGQMRCCTATIGDAAAADVELYPNLYGTILIWLGTAHRVDTASLAEQRRLFAASLCCALVGMSTQPIAVQLSVVGSDSYLGRGRGYKWSRSWGSQEWMQLQGVRSGCSRPS